MKIIISTLCISGLLLSCSYAASENQATPTNTETAEPLEKKDDYKEITLSENSIDTFQLPFPHKEMVDDLQSFYSPYQVQRQVGQQDGPDFEFISISRKSDPVVYFSFDPDERLKLDDVMILDSTAVDEYGVRVGDSYAQVKEKRPIEFKNQTNFHQHTYLFNETSNIYYEIIGDLSEADIANIEDLQLTDERLQTWRVDKIFWRK